MNEHFNLGIIDYLQNYVEHTQKILFQEKLFKVVNIFQIYSLNNYNILLYTIISVMRSSFNNIIGRIFQLSKIRKNYNNYNNTLIYLVPTL